MKSAWIAALGLAALLAATSVAEARHYGSRPSHGFRTGHCKRASCFARHPGGRYVYPLHYGHRRHR